MITPLARAPFTPPAVLLLLYGSLVVAGTLLLKLPWAATHHLSWLSAAFTATSAVTITGLSVVDTGPGFTPFGQAVILLLIQLGGLGIMTFAVRILAIFGMPIGLRQRITLGEDLNNTEFGDLLDLARLMIRFVLVAELAGAVLLSFRFVPDIGWAGGIWAAVFHSVSAFNNAGFSLFTRSLSAWSDDPLVNVVVPALYIVGGLGFTVVFDLYRVRRWRGLSLHTKLMLTGTAALIVVSVAATLLLEWNNPGTLGALKTTGAKLMAGWFQATTTRTAGFNTIPIGDLHETTALMFIVLMLIGGGSTSTAGGIKVTTFVVLLIVTIGFMRGQRRIHAFGRELGETEILKVLALAVASASFVSVAMFLLMLTQDGLTLDLGFEAASALGTVGLSRGVTPNLDTVGRLLVMVLMFAGRVGPLAFGFVLARRGPPLLRYPPGKVYLG